MRSCLGQHTEDTVTKYHGYCLDAWGNDQTLGVETMGCFSEEDCLNKCKDLSKRDVNKGCEGYKDGQCFAHTREVIIGGEGDNSDYTCWVFGKAGTIVIPD